MIDKLNKLAFFIDTLSVRERAMIFLALVSSVFFIVQFALLDPLDLQAKQLAIEIKKQNKDLVRVRDQQQLVLTRAGLDPDENNRKKIATVQQALIEMDKRLRDMTVDLIPPNEMATVLEEVLTRETDLKLIAVKVLKPKPLTEENDASSGVKKADTASVLPGVYQHSLQIELEGTYLSTLRYMQALEALPRRFFWGEADFKIDKYPRAQITIIVNTLSLNEAWIGV